MRPAQANWLLNKRRRRTGGGNSLSITAPVEQEIVTQGVAYTVTVASRGNTTVEIYDGASKLGDAVDQGDGTFTYSWTPASVDYGIELNAVGDKTGTTSSLTIVAAESNEIATDISTWTKSNASISISGSQSDPDGGSSAYKVNTYAASNTAQYIQAAASGAPTELDAGFEIWVKPDGHDVLCIEPQEETASHIAYIDLTTGEKQVDDAMVAVVETKDGWYRVWYRGANGSTAGPQTFRLYMCKALGDNTPDSSANEGMFFYEPRTADGILPMTEYQKFAYYQLSTTSGVWGQMDTYSYKHPYIKSEADLGGSYSFIRVFKPTTWSSSNTYKRVFILPPLGWGSIPESAFQDTIGQYANRFNVVMILPHVFNDGSWWGSKNDGTNDAEALVTDILTRFSEEVFATSSARADTLVMGYSKSGVSAFSMILRNPTVFGGALAWDANFNASYPGSLGLDTQFGTEAHWLTYDPLEILSASEASINDTKRLVLAGNNLYSADTVAMKNALDALSPVPEYYYKNRAETVHSFNDGWLHYGLAELMRISGVSIDPYIVETEPADDATGVAATDNITIRFNEDVILPAGGGQILLRENDGGWATVETFTRTSDTAATGSNGGTISIAGEVLTINPGNDMTFEVEHSVQIPATAIDSAAGRSFAGVTDDTTISWTVAADGTTTTLLLNLNGTDGATSTTDASPTGHAVTFVGNAQLDTADKKFGSASLLLDGTGDAIRLPGNDEHAFGTGAFTVEAFYKANGTPGLWMLFDFTTGTTGMRLYSNGASLFLQTNNTTRISGSALSASTWHHICVQRLADGTMRLFRDGAQIGSDYASSENFTNIWAAPHFGPWFGSNTSGSGFYWNGWIDDIRIVKGEAVYGDVTSFTAPTAELGLT